MTIGWTRRGLSQRNAAPFDDGRGKEYRMDKNDRLEVHSSWKCMNCGIIAYSFMPQVICPMCERPSMFAYDVATEDDMGDAQYRRKTIAGLQAIVEEILEQNLELNGRLSRIRERCEANNWMGTVRIRGDGG